MSECTACAASNMAIGDALGRDPHRPRRRDVRRRHARRRSRASASPASTRCARSRAATTIRSARRGRSTATRRARDGRGGRACSCSRSSSAPRRAARRSTRELLGYGISADAPHMTEPDPTGQSPARAMTMALARRGRRADRDRLRERARNLDAARRRSRDEGDQARARRGARAQHRRSPRRRARPGHCFGAAGAIEAVFTTLAVARPDRPADDQHRDPDPDCDLDYVPNSRPRGPGSHGALELVRLRRP